MSDERAAQLKRELACALERVEDLRALLQAERDERHRAEGRAEALLEVLAAGVTHRPVSVTSQRDSHAGERDNQRDGERDQEEKEKKKQQARERKARQRLRSASVTNQRDSVTRHAPSSSSSSSPSAEDKGERALRVVSARDRHAGQRDTYLSAADLPPEEAGLWRAWNDVCGAAGHPRLPRRVSGALLADLQAALSERPVAGPEGWGEVFARVLRCPVLRGAGRRPQLADYVYVLRGRRPDGHSVADGLLRGAFELEPAPSAEEPEREEPGALVQFDKPLTPAEPEEDEVPLAPVAAPPPAPAPPVASLEVMLARIYEWRVGRSMGTRPTTSTLASLRQAAGGDEAIIASVWSLSLTNAMGTNTTGKRPFGVTSLKALAQPSVWPSLLAELERLRRDDPSVHCVARCRVPDCDGEGTQGVCAPGGRGVHPEGALCATHYVAFEGWVAVAAPPLATTEEGVAAVAQWLASLRPLAPVEHVNSFAHPPGGSPISESYPF